MKIRMWLDDERKPPDMSWTHVKTIAQAKAYMGNGYIEVVDASLDHDLGMGAGNFDEKLGRALTGYDLVCWFEEKNVWPTRKVTVHSANPVGKEKMELVIEKHYKERQ